jgi:hypothetical protein
MVLALVALVPTAYGGVSTTEADLYVDPIGELTDRNEDDLFQINITTGSLGPDTAEGAVWTIDGTNVVVDEVSVDVGSCTTPNAADVSCVIGENPPFSGRSIAVTYTVPDPGVASITSSITSSTFDPETSNNSDLETFFVNAGPDTDPPETSISGPSKTAKRKPKIILESNEPVGATFECSVDSKAFKVCESQVFF